MSAAWPLADTSVGQFRGAYLREHQKTWTVLHAFPSDKPEFRPHDRSNTARQIAWTFVMEEAMMLKAIRCEPILGGSGSPKAPESWDAVLQSFDSMHKDIIRELDRLNAAPANSVKFFSGPNQTADYPAMEFLWFLLCDQIHHRGQLSVYVRMAGGKVPAIYGPSADEKWF